MSNLTTTEDPVKRTQPSDAEFYARGIARSRYHDRLFVEGRTRPTNEQFDEGWTAGRAYTQSSTEAPLLTVESAFKDLREMFGDKRDYEIRLRSWGYPYLIHVMTNAGLRMDFKANTLDEAMAQVRGYWKEQTR